MKRLSDTLAFTTKTPEKLNRSQTKRHIGEFFENLSTSVNFSVWKTRPRPAAEIG